MEEHENEERAEELNDEELAEAAGGSISSTIKKIKVQSKTM